MSGQLLIDTKTFQINIQISKYFASQQTALLELLAKALYKRDPSKKMCSESVVVSAAKEHVYFQGQQI